MQRLILFYTLLLFTSIVSYSQKQKSNSPQNCQSEWKYNNLKKGFKGTVVFFEQPAVMCGIVSTASVALIKSDNGDTVRVLTMCNTKKDFNESPKFKTGEKVMVTPDEKPSFRIDIIPVDLASCRLKMAYFGFIEKAK